MAFHVSGSWALFQKVSSGLLLNALHALITGGHFYPRRELGKGDPLSTCDWRAPLPTIATGPGTLSKSPWAHTCFWASFSQNFSDMGSEEPCLSSCLQVGHHSHPPYDPRR